MSATPLTAPPPPESVPSPETAAAAEADAALAAASLDSPIKAPTYTGPAGKPSAVLGAAPSGRQFRLELMPYGILGTRMPAAGVRPAPIVMHTEPDTDTVFVDAAGLHHVQGLAKRGPAGAAKAVYDFVGGVIDPLSGCARLPDPVKAAVTQDGDAKLHTYTPPASRGTYHVIHAVGPNFVPPGWPMKKSFPKPTAAEFAAAVPALGVAYTNTLREFARSPFHSLRLLPLSSGIFAGPMESRIVELTRRALEAGFAGLSAGDQEALVAANRRLHMCVFMESEYDAFAQGLCDSA